MMATQVADYDRLTEKLEKSIGEARSASDAARKEASDNAEAMAALKVERNELKSSLIYAETQLREVKAKHDDVEQLFREAIQQDKNYFRVIFKVF